MLISFEYTVKYCVIIGCHSVVAAGKCCGFNNNFLKFVLVCLFVILNFKILLSFSQNRPFFFFFLRVGYKTFHYACSFFFSWIFWAAFHGPHNVLFAYTQVEHKTLLLGKSAEFICILKQTLFHTRNYGLQFLDCFSIWMMFIQSIRSLS